MKVTFLTSELALGGAERQWVGLIPDLVPYGIDPQVLCINGGGSLLSRLSTQGIPCHVLAHDNDPSILFRLSRFPSYFRDYSELVVSLGFNAHAIGSIAARAARIPHVISWHYSGKPIPRRRELILRFCGRMGDQVISVSRSQGAHLARAGFDSTQVQIIPNGVAERHPQRSREEVRAALGVPESSSVVLALGRLVPEKRLDRFLAAVALARAGGVDVVGFIAGEGPERPTLARLAQQFGASRLLGARSDVDDLLAAADALCLTSDHEAMPMVLLEAMAAGVPVITTEAGDARAIVDQGRSGIVVADKTPEVIGAAIRRVLAPDARPNMALAARQAYEQRFRHDVMVSRYAQAFHEIKAVGPSRGGRRR